MTWGSNPSFAMIPCRWCYQLNCDDTSEGETKHEMRCSKRPSRWKFWRFW